MDPINDPSLAPSQRAAACSCSGWTHAPPSSPRLELPAQFHQPRTPKAAKKPVVFDISSAFVTPGHVRSEYMSLNTTLQVIDRVSTSRGRQPEGGGIHVSSSQVVVESITPSAY